MNKKVKYCISLMNWQLSTAIFWMKNMEDDNIMVFGHIVLYITITNIHIGLI